MHLHSTFSIEKKQDLDTSSDCLQTYSSLELENFFFFKIWQVFLTRCSQSMDTSVIFYFFFSFSSKSSLLCTLKVFLFFFFLNKILTFLTPMIRHFRHCTFLVNEAMALAGMKVKIMKWWSISYLFKEDVRRVCHMTDSTGSWNYSREKEKMILSHTELSSCTFLAGFMNLNFFF